MSNTTTENTAKSFEERIKEAREANRKAAMFAWQLATMDYKMSYKNN